MILPRPHYSLIQQKPVTPKSFQKKKTTRHLRHFHCRCLIKKIDRTTELKTNYQDGQCLSPQETLLTIHGNANTILMLERTLLNFLRHLSAIATLTRQFVDKVSHTHLKLLDTRKTTPGFRHLEKYAVHCGGGINHRMGLYDAILIKDTHIDFLGGLENALQKIPNKYPLPVIVEIRNQQEFDIAIQYPQKLRDYCLTTCVLNNSRNMLKTRQKC